MVNFLIFIAVLGVLIFVHELGHFLSAKRLGVKVEKFALGFGPRLLGFKKGETDYCLNLVPFGGYVKIFGEDSDEKLPGSFSSRPASQRAAIVSAGIFFNFLLAFVLLSLIFTLGAPAAVGQNEPGRVTILEVRENSAAYTAGLKVGDQLLSLSSGTEMDDAGSAAGVQEFISLHKGREIIIKYRRGENIFSVSVIPAPILGISMEKIGIISLPFYKALWEGLKEAVLLTLFMFKMVVLLLLDIIRGGDMVSQVSGPVGIFSLVSSAAAFGFAYLLRFTALLSLNLMVINLLPFPALDGGHLLLLGIEAAKRSPLNRKAVAVANGLGFAILILLMILVTYQDIMHF